MVESSQKLVLTLRWIQWVLGAYSFGVCLTYFLIDVNFYLWIQPMARAQLGLAGTLHVYLYLAAIWGSVKPQGPLAWAILDVIFALLAIATAATGQQNISEYCSKSSMTLFWSDAQFAYVPQDQRLPSDTSTMREIISGSYLEKGCGFHAGVIAANAIIVILFTITAFVQVKQHREDSQTSPRYTLQHEKPQDQRTGWRKSLAAPFARRNMNLEV